MNTPNNCQKSLWNTISEVPRKCPTTSYNANVRPEQYFIKCPMNCPGALLFISLVFHTITKCPRAVHFALSLTREIEGVLKPPLSLVAREIPATASKALCENTSKAAFKSLSAPTTLPDPQKRALAAIRTQKNGIPRAEHEPANGHQLNTERQ